MEPGKGLFEDRPDIHESRLWQTENILSSLRSSLNSRSVFRRSYHDNLDEYVQFSDDGQQANSPKLFNPKIFSPTRSPLDWPLRQSPLPKTFNDPNSNLPLFDRSVQTWQASIGVIAAGVLTAAGCLAYSIYVYAAKPSEQIDHVNLGTTAREVLTLAVLFALTFMTDQLSYMHSTSLRWALYSEGRLHFNTNIRLLTRARSSWLHHWGTNALSLAILALGPAAAGQLFIQFWGAADATAPQAFAHESTAVNAAAVFALGVAQLGAAALAAAGLARAVPTWSANPLNTTLAALRARSARVPARCMLGVHEREAKGGACRPRARQRSAWSARAAVRRVTGAVWAFALLAAVPATAWGAVEGVQYGFASISLVDTPLGFFTTRFGAGSVAKYHTVVQAILALLFLFALQGLQTLALHSAELVANMSRDESVWRKAALPEFGNNRRRKEGAWYRTNPFLTAATSWHSGVLFFTKVVMHFLLSQTVALASLPVEDLNGSSGGSDTNDGPRSLAVVVRLPFAIAFGGTAIMFALFITYLAVRRPKGPQPAAYGHIQTLADLIDDWSTTGEGLFWGGKTTNYDGTRHAGTSAIPENLSKINMDSDYS